MPVGDIKRKSLVKYQDFNYYEDANYGIFGILKPLITLVKSFLGIKTFGGKGGFIGQLYNLFSNIRISLNPESDLTLEEKEISKYSKLFNMAAIEQYKAFNKYYRDLIKNNFTEKQILKKFFKLIENNNEIDSNKTRFLLFQQAEKELLGDKITAKNMSEILSKRVEENLNKVLKVYLENSDKSAEELNNLETECNNKIITVRIILKKLVDLISKEEEKLENFKLENKTEENKIKYSMHQNILIYKKKLYSFILRTDAWAIGETVEQDKIFNKDYIKKQFDKLPIKKTKEGELELVDYEFDEPIKHKGVLKLFENNIDKLKENQEYKESIERCKTEEIEQYLLPNTAESIKSYNYLNCILSGKSSEVSDLNKIIDDYPLTATTTTVQLKLETLKIRNKLSKLQGQEKEIKSYIQDLKARIILSLFNYYKMQNIAQNHAHKIDEIKNKILEFIQNLSPTIMFKDIVENNYLDNILIQLTENVQAVKDDMEYFNEKEKLNFFAIQLKNEANNFLNSVKVADKLPANDNTNRPPLLRAGLSS